MSPPLPPPAITVAAVVQADGRFLLVEERIDGRRVLNQPAGHVEPGETLLAAVVREAQEETAWRFQPEALLGIYLWRHPDTGLGWLRFAFTGTVSDHDPAQPLDEPIVRTHWLSRGDLIQGDHALRSPMVLRCLEDHQAGIRHALSAVAALTLTDAHAAPVPVVTL